MNESPYCSCMQQQQPQHQQPLLPNCPTAEEQPHLFNNPQNQQEEQQQNTSQTTSFITFRPKVKSPLPLPPPPQPPFTSSVTSNTPPCGTGVRHISAARSLDLLKDSEHHHSKVFSSPNKTVFAFRGNDLHPVNGNRNSNNAGQEDKTSNNNNSNSFGGREPSLKTTTSSSFPSHGYLDNSNNKSI